MAWNPGQGFYKNLRGSVEEKAVGIGRGKQNEVLEGVTKELEILT